MGTDEFIAAGTAADAASVRALAPLAADRMISCGPFTVASSVLAAVPTLEQESGEPARVLRAFLGVDPFAGMGSVRPGGWMLLARSDGVMVLGQREGAVGLGAVVVFTREAGRFEATSMGSWSLAGERTDEGAEYLDDATADGDAVQLRWECGQGLDGSPGRVVSRVDLLETVDRVHVLVWSRPARRAAAPDVGWMVGTGRSAAVQLALREPLGGRTLLNDFRVPPEEIPPGSRDRAR